MSSVDLAFSARDLAAVVPGPHGAWCAVAMASSRRGGQIVGTFFPVPLPAGERKAEPCMCPGFVL